MQSPMAEYVALYDGADNTLIDNLTYTYPSTSNRLSSVADAVGATAETWDAETGTFAYDANGNVTAAAPLAITTAVYDWRNLPTTITRGGTSSSYRYSASGDRYRRKVGAGAAEVLVLDGPATVGVFTEAGALVETERGVCRPRADL